MNKKQHPYRLLALSLGATILCAVLLRLVGGLPSGGRLHSQVANDPGLVPEISQELACLYCRFQDFAECDVSPDDCGNVVINGLRECQVYAGTCMSRFQASCEMRASEFQHTNIPTQVLITPLSDPVDLNFLTECTSITYIDEKHSNPVNRLCVDDVIPIKACIDVAPLCTQFTYLNNGCSTFRRVADVEEWARSLVGSEALAPGVSISVSGNQTIVGSNGCNESLVTVHIDCTGVTTEYPKCHEATDSCVTNWVGGVQNTPIKCEDADGAIRQEICCNDAQGQGRYVPGSQCPTYGQCNGVGTAYSCSQATTNAQQTAQRCMDAAMTACEAKGWSFVPAACNSYVRNNSLAGSCNVETQCPWSCIDDAGIAGGTGGGGSW